MTTAGHKYPKMSEAKMGKPWAGRVRRIVVHVQRDTYFAIAAKAQKFICLKRYSYIVPEDALEAYVEWLLEQDRKCLLTSKAPKVREVLTECSSKTGT